MNKKKFNLIIFFIFLSCIISSNNILAKGNPNELLKKADELFDKKQYLEAFIRYQKIYETHKNYSPKMLLKMSMIKEEEGDISAALFYINLYYNKTKDHTARQYMQRLGGQNHFAGYQINDEEYLNYFLEKYKNNIQISLSILAIITALFIAYSQFYRHSISVASITTFSFIIICLLFITNIKSTNNHLVIKRSNVRLMEYPSSGAPVIDKLSLGDRYKVISKKDVWWEVITINKKVGYVREQNVIAPNLL